MSNPVEPVYFSHTDSWLIHQRDSSEACVSFGARLSSSLSTQHFHPSSLHNFIHIKKNKKIKAFDRTPSFHFISLPPSIRPSFPPSITSSHSEKSRISNPQLFWSGDKRNVVESRKTHQLDQTAVSPPTTFPWAPPSWPPYTGPPLLHNEPFAKRVHIWSRNLLQSKLSSFLCLWATVGGNLPIGNWEQRGIGATPPGGLDVVLRCRTTHNICIYVYMFIYMEMYL